MKPGSVILLVFKLSILSVLQSCEKDDLTAITSFSTTEVSDITTTTARSGGKVNANKVLDITAFGVCFNTTGSPTTSDRIAAGEVIALFEERVSFSKEFRSNLFLLTPGSTYYIRAFITTPSGTVYGDELTFRTR